MIKLKEMMWFRSLLMLSLFALSSACGNDDEVTTGTAKVDFEITDAPSDDANVKGVIVTIAELKVNGKSIEGFQKQTIDLKAYNEGNTKLLGNTVLQSGTHGNITMVLDLNSDANGNAPGCYVLSQDNSKHKLQTTTSGMLEVAVNKSWSIKSDVENTVVVDFDIRKAIKRTDSGESEYGFIATADLQNAIRVVTKERSGMIRGSLENDDQIDAEKVVVYAYKKGTFNAETEIGSEGDIQFKNAVTSAEVKMSLTGNTYTLAFLEEGEYELHFIGYNTDDSSGRLMYTSRIEAETTVNGSVGEMVNVEAGATVEITSSVKGIF